jgi:hypothetical protein
MRLYSWLDSSLCWDCAAHRRTGPCVRRRCRFDSGKLDVRVGNGGGLVRSPRSPWNVEGGLCLPGSGSIQGGRAFRSPHLIQIQ